MLCRFFTFFEGDQDPDPIAWCGSGQATRIHDYLLLTPGQFYFIFKNLSPYLPYRAELVKKWKVINYGWWILKNTLLLIRLVDYSPTPPWLLPNIIYLPDSSHGAPTPSWYYTSPTPSILYLLPHLPDSSLQLPPNTIPFWLPATTLIILYLPKSSHQLLPNTKPPWLLPPTPS